MTVSSTSHRGPAWSSLSEPIFALPYSGPAMKATSPDTQTCAARNPDGPRASGIPDGFFSFSIWDRQFLASPPLNVHLGRRRRRAARPVPCLYGASGEARIVSWAAGAPCPACAPYKHGRSGAARRRLRPPPTTRPRWTIWDGWDSNLQLTGCVSASAQWNHPSASATRSATRSAMRSAAVRSARSAAAGPRADARLEFVASPRCVSQMVDLGTCFSIQNRPSQMEKDQIPSGIPDARGPSGLRAG